MKKTILTGITPSGVPHIGNYIGAIKPSVELSKDKNLDCFYFIADYHSLVKLWDPLLRKKYLSEIASTWLALGLDYENVTFYRQSDIPEILELNWILATVASKGLLNRGHAYKSLVDKNKLDDKKDPDSGITMGLFNYPVLMAADILLFDANLVPVGKDQIQHVEIARDIATRFNHIYKKNRLILPEALTQENAQTILGLDGRKMSKSYNNTISLFSTEKVLRKSIMKIVTNSQLPEEKKNPDTCTVFSIYKSIANHDEVQNLRELYEKGGLGWGQAKQILFEKMNILLAPYREKYEYFINNPKKVDDILAEGGQKARERASKNLNEIRNLIGM